MQEIKDEISSENKRMRRVIRNLAKALLDIKKNPHLSREDLSFEPVEKLLESIEVKSLSRDLAGSVESLQIVCA